MVTDVLIWTCTIVFVATAAITLLSIIDIIKIKDEFRSKLFYALIIEVIVSGVIVFKKTISENPINIIRVVSPLSGTQSTLYRGVPFYFNGFCQKQADVTFKGDLIVRGEHYDVNGFRMDDRNVFTVSTLIRDTFTNAQAKILLKLVSDNKIIFKDSSTIYISVK